jgi:acylphosphatase
MAGTAIRREAFYEGYVQGVGFRYTTRAIAGGFSVTGYVKNLPDGRVHVLAEGLPDEVAGFLKAIEDRMGRYIRHVETRNGVMTGEFAAFDIAF